MLSAWGPLGLLVLAAADSAGIPIVGGVDLLLISVAVNRPGAAYGSALCAVAGSLAGSSFLFALARKGGAVFLARHTEAGTGRRLRHWFHRYGLTTVFVPAVSFIPLPMKIPVFCAGALHVRWRDFLGTVLVARTIRYGVLAFLALTYGTRTLAFLKTHALAAGLAAAVLTLAALLTLRRLSRTA